jgi:hypothetical protein
MAAMSLIPLNSPVPCHELPIKEHRDLDHRMFRLAQRIAIREGLLPRALAREAERAIIAKLSNAGYILRNVLDREEGNV